MRKARILITGSSGTVGTRLFEKLLEKGYKVVGFDKRKNEWSLSLDKLTIRGNLLDQRDIKKIPKNFDIIVHLAANARVYDSVVDPTLALENMLTTYNTLEFARENKIKKFIFSSSREIYGNREQQKKFEEKEADFHICEGPYAASKVSGEALTYAYRNCYGIDYIIFRLSNVYGMYDQSERFIPLMIRRMRKDQKVYIYGKDKLLDFTYIDDCIDGIIKGIEKFQRAKNNTFNLAGGKGCKLVDVANLIKKLLKSKSQIIVTEPRTSEVIRYIADISQAKKILGYRPKYSLEKGVRASLDWYLNQK